MIAKRKGIVARRSLKKAWSKGVSDHQLKLKVNAEKSAVARPQQRKLLGFSLSRRPVLSVAAHGLLVSGVVVWQGASG